MEITDVGPLYRYYFDANTWDFVAKHWDRDRLMRYLSRPGRRAILPSMVNIVELLRAPANRRELLAETLSAMLDPKHAVLGEPMYILEQAALAFRRRDLL